MRRVVATVAVAALLAAGGCEGGRPTAAPSVSPSVSLSVSPSPSVSPTARPAAVLVGAGDIADCNTTADSDTAALVARTPGTVFTLGDNAYPNGTAQDFARCYEPTWGRFRDRTRPTVGNHEYESGDPAAYFDYFGAAAGPRGRGWYSYDAGSWHVVVLNSNCALVPGGCAAGSPQERWLRADLARAGKPCTVAMWHTPLFTSGTVHPGAAAVRPLFRALYEAGVELLLTGHNHQYERFAPQTPTGGRDAARGVRELVVGTGGASTYAFGTPAPNSEVRIAGTHGVLRLSLTDGAYDWRFLPVGSARGDAGHGVCH